MEFEDRQGYKVLLDVLKEAYDQASIGKGFARHGYVGADFTEQKIITGQRKYGMGFALGQADKKMEEAFNLDDWEAARKDLLGAIVYICGAIIYGDEVYRTDDNLVGLTEQGQQEEEFPRPIGEDRVSQGS